MKNKLITLAILSIIGSSSANAIELNVPSFLGGKSEAMPTITVGTKSNAEAAITGSSTKGIVKPITAAAADKPTTVIASTNTKVNPYTGVRTDVEETKSKIDAAIAQADLYEKEFDAGKKKYLLDNKDKLYKKELSEKLGSGSIGSSGRGSINIPDLSNFDAQLAKATSKKGKTSAAPIEMVKASIAPPPVPSTPKLVGVMSNGHAKSAILTMGGESTPVSEGDIFSGYKVSGITDTSVMLDGKKINLSVAANTLSNPDKQSIGTGGLGGKGSAPSNGNPMQSAQPVSEIPMAIDMPMM